jgi:aminoglycoside phosphotransferase (APT) family kinase protein
VHAVYRLGDRYCATPAGAAELARAAGLLALAGPAWSGCPVWIHADLLRPNLLVDGGRIRAVIDFGGPGAATRRPT